MAIATYTYRYATINSDYKHGSLPNRQIEFHMDQNTQKYQALVYVLLNVHVSDMMSVSQYKSNFVTSIIEEDNIILNSRGNQDSAASSFSSLTFEQKRELLQALGREVNLIVTCGLDEVVRVVHQTAEQIVTDTFENVTKLEMIDYRHR